jgi:hypothetical protein
MVIFTPRTPTTTLDIDATRESCIRRNGLLNAPYHVVYLDSPVFKTRKVVGYRGVLKPVFTSR